MNEQKYCRACGMELTPVAALVAGRGAPPPSFKPGKSDQETTFRAVKLVAAGIFLFFLGALLSGAGKRVFHREDVVTIGIFFLVFGMITTVFALFQGLWAKTKPRTAARISANTQPDLEAPQAVALPLAFPSITESTTRIMDGDPSLPSEDQTSSPQAG